MKKLWALLFAMLLTCTMLLGAWAEAGADDGTISAEPVDTVVPEIEEFSLGEEPLYDEETVDFDTEAEAKNDTIVPAASLEMSAKTALSDFDITNGVLIKYKGAGGRVVIPDGVTSIWKNAFQFATVSSVDIPSSVTSIGEWAFSPCENLQSITIPSSVTNIDEGAFANCFSLKSVTIPNGVTNLSASLFYNCKKLESISLPDSLLSIGVLTFENCTSLTQIEIPNRVTTIDWGAFSGCTYLKSITIPKSVNYIGPYAFRDCPSLASITIQSIAIDIDGDAFENVPKLVTFNTICETPATKWARENGFKVVASAHTQTTVKGKAATCSATGLTDGVKCSVCNTWITPQKTIAKKAHTPQTVKGYAATYDREGLTDGVKCSVCGTWITPQRTIAKLQYPTRVLDRVKNNGTVTVNVGDRIRLVPQFATSAGASVTGYKSGKVKFATIDGGGLVTAVAEGKSKITVTTNNKKVKATITVVVVDPYKPTGIAIAQGKTVTLNMGQKLKLNAQLAPASARATLTWKSSKPKVATVDGSGNVVPVGEGKTKITVTTHNKKKATITVQVVDPYKPLGISINQGKTVTIKVGQTLRLGATLNPASARSALTWTSKKPAIATVDGSGNVKGVKKGKTKITVSTYNKKKATITVVVTE